MPAVTENLIQGLASCRDGRCPGYKQMEVDAVVTITAFSYFDLGGDVPGIERESILIRFSDPDTDMPCPVCGEPRLVSDQTRPIYPNVSGVPQDKLLHVGEDSERVRDLQLDNANAKAQNAQMQALMERQAAAMERQQEQIDQLLAGQEKPTPRPRKAE